jgi:hypothetical protein
MKTDRQGLCMRPDMLTMIKPSRTARVAAYCDTRVALQAVSLLLKHGLHMHVMLPRMHL